MDKQDRKRIILYRNPEKPQALDAANGLLEWMGGRADIVAENIRQPLDPTKFPPADFLIILGGDGTILSMIRAMGKNQIPVIGVNMGKLGFLAEFNLEHLQKHFDRLISDPNLLTRRVVLQCQITGSSHPLFYSPIVNELAVISGPPFRMIQLSLAIGKEHIALCSGDGLIVSTSTGSTAYNLSAGGPILAETLPAAVITPLAAHSLGFRPIVIDLDKPIEIQCCRTHPGEGSAPSVQAIVAIDGQVHTQIGCEDVVEISKAGFQSLMVRHPGRSQWKLLNKKLNWGVLPNYNDFSARSSEKE